MDASSSITSGFRRRGAARLLRLLGLAALVGSFALPSSAMAVAVNSGPTTTVAPATALAANAAYSFGRYRTGGNESVTAWALTFPAGTVVSAAYLPNATVTVTGQTVRVTLARPIGPRSNFTATIEGIVNPAAGTYNPGNITFYTIDKQGRTGTSNAATGNYTITPGAPYLALTISTPDPDQTVDFGDIDPGMTAGPALVTVEVNSSAPYTVTRTLSGSVTALGLSVTGSATGAHPAGFASYTDSYTLTPSYSTTPEIPLNAAVLYTVVQQ